MHLKESEVVFLEGAEDFDIHEGDTVEATQVKDTARSGSITLRTPDVLKTINNLWKHQQLNPDKKISVRFLTTAAVGQEKGIVFPITGKGIEYWGLAARDDRTPIQPLKDFLLELDLDNSLKKFLEQSGDSVIRNELIRSIHWDTGSKPKDALIAEISDRLVLLGEKRGVDSRHSEQALDSLLRKVADLLGSQGDRHLNYADFLRAFDEATMELMPRGQATALRSVINQLSISNLSLPASNVHTIISMSQVFGTPLPLVRGASSRESLVSTLSDTLRRYGALVIRGSTGVGKTSIARLITDHFGGTWLWAGFRARDGTQVAYELHQAALELSRFTSPLQIVLDDLDLSTVSRFERELISLAFSVINNGGVLIITGPTSCQSSVLEKLWLSQECNKEIPYLDEREIEQIMVNHGALETEEIKQWSRFILVTTTGHPQLVHARVRNLQSQNWPPFKDARFLETADLQQEKTFAYRRLIEEIPSEGARSVAYRLSLLSGKFSRQLALKLANLPPNVPFPGEGFDILVGPWIEKLSEDSYRVSPLLQNSGETALSFTEKHAVHEGIALGISEQRSLSQYEFSTALSHAFLAKSEKALGFLASATIYAASGKVWRALADAAFWYPSMGLQPGQRLCETNPSIDVLLRVAQFKMTAAAGRHSEALLIIDRTIELVENLAPSEEATTSAALAYSTFLISLETAIPAQKAINMLSRLMDLRKIDEDIDKLWRNFETAQQPGAPLAGLSMAQALFSIRASNVTGLSDLDNLMAALETLDDQKRADLFTALRDTTVQLADLLIGGAWSRDASKGHLDVLQGVTVLKKAVTFGRKWNVTELACAAYVAMSVIYDEYGSDSNSALQVLQEASDDGLDSEPRILNQRAKVFFGLKNYERALELFQSVLSGDALPTIERTFSSRLAGISAAHIGDWKSAEGFFLTGAVTANTTRVQQNIVIGLMADAAFARWKQGQLRDSFSLYADVLRQLESIPLDQNLSNRQLHASIRHCVAWILTAGRSGPDRSMTDPQPGTCSNPDAHTGFKDLTITPMPAIWGLLGNLDTQMGTGLELMKLAEEKCHGELPVLIRLYERFTKYEALWKAKDFSVAVPVIVDIVEASTYQKETLDPSIDLLTPGGEIPRLTTGYWAQADNRVSVLYPLLSVAVLATAKQPDSELTLERWKKDLHTRGIRA
jgi:tetratricopeptide (TPR) repeat protein